MTLHGGVNMMLLSGDENISEDTFKSIAHVATQFMANRYRDRPSLPPWAALRTRGPGYPRKVYPAADPAVFNLHSIPTEGLFIVLPGRSIMSAHALAGAG